MTSLVGGQGLLSASSISLPYFSGNKGIVQSLNAQGETLGECYGQPVTEREDLRMALEPFLGDTRFKLCLDLTLA